MTKERVIAVIARSDPAEAMRVASGITIFGHQVSLVFAHGPLQITPQIVVYAELLGFADVEPVSLFDDPEVPKIQADELTKLLNAAEVVINV